MRNCGSDRGAEEEEVETGARETRRSKRGRGRVYQRDGERPRETGQEKINRPANMCQENGEG